MRKVKVQLQLPSGLRLNGGKLRVTYTEMAEQGGKDLANATFDIP